MRGGRKACFVAFTDFHGVNTLNIANFKLPMWYHWLQELGRDVHSQLSWADLSLLQHTTAYRPCQTLLIHYLKSSWAHLLFQALQPLLGWLSLVPYFPDWLFIFHSLYLKQDMDKKIFLLRKLVFRSTILKSSSCLVSRLPSTVVHVVSTPGSAPGFLLLCAGGGCTVCG